MGGWQNKGIEKISKSTCKFTKTNSIDNALVDFGVCCYGDHQIMIAGGFVGYKEPTNRCFVYDSVKNELKAIKSLNRRRGSTCLVNVGNNFYCVGGETTGGALLSSIEIYRAETDTWEIVDAELKAARRDHKAVAHGNSVVIIGGSNGDGEAELSIEIFNTGNNRVVAMESYLSVGRMNFACCKISDDIYVIGGRDSSYSAVNTVEVLNVTDETIQTKGGLPYTDYGLSACVLYK